MKIKPPTGADWRLAYRDVFAKNAQIRTKKAIHDLILQYWLSKKSLGGSCGVRKVVHSLRTLLKEGAFKLKARASKEQDRDALLSMSSTIPLLVYKLISVEEDSRPNSIERARALSALEPPRFPYDVQHRILLMTQQLLE